MNVSVYYYKAQVSFKVLSMLTNMTPVNRNKLTMEQSLEKRYREVWTDLNMD